MCGMVKPRADFSQGTSTSQNDCSAVISNDDVVVFAGAMSAETKLRKQLVS